MATNEYHFITHWRIGGDIREIADILNDPLGLPRWWPSVYLDVREIRPSGVDGVGREIALYTKGWLPYTLRWQFRITETRYPYGFTLEAQGDFVGRGIWILTQDGPSVDVTYDWKIVVAKPLLRRLSFLFKPIFAANHQWAMAMGERSLLLEVARRHASTPEERAAVPAPPPPTMLPRVSPAVAALVGFGMAGAMIIQVRRARQAGKMRP